MPDGTNLHVADELVLLEVMDDQTGKPCEAGETGSVVITSFFNQAMPLIRYKLGDLATVGHPVPAAAASRPCVHRRQTAPALPLSRWGNDHAGSCDKAFCRVFACPQMAGGANWREDS